MKLFQIHIQRLKKDFVNVLSIKSFIFKKNQGNVWLKFIKVSIFNSGSKITNTWDVEMKSTVCAKMSILQEETDMKSYSYK